MRISKTDIFVTVTILFICNLITNMDSNGGFMNNLVLIILYVVFILISLYELGKDEVENE
jgi:hypothetical protein